MLPKARSGREWARSRTAPTLSLHSTGLLAVIGSRMRSVSRSTSQRQSLGNATSCVFVVH